MKKTIACVIVMLFTMIVASSATATTSPTEQVCTQGDCKVVPATLVTTATPFTTTTTTTTAWQKDVTTYEKSTKRTIVVWYSTKRLVPKAGTKCYAVGRGTKYPWFWNSFRRASDGKQVWFKDTRRSKLCGTGKHAKKGKNLKRTACQNPSRLPTQPAPPKVRILKKKNVKEFKTLVQVKKYLKEQGNETRTTVTTGTTTTAHYVCPQGYVMIDGNMCKYCPPPVCKPPVKDGTQTPPPPADAPGPNPSPSPDDPTVTPENPTGSWQCYDQDTGDPVQPRADGTCPPGSYGG